MNAAQKRADKIMAGARLILIALPILSFAFSVWSWLRFGVDIPVYDDWRQYKSNDMGRLDLGYLFTPHNDTLYTFGLLLDSLAFRFLDGNTVAYQLLSMVFVLGGMLALQFTLLRKYATNKTALAIAFSFTLLMLQPDTYWGWQNLAYHQAIPLLCVLGIFALITSSKIAKPIVLASIAALGLISGLSYISGAFSALVLAVVLLAYGVMSTHPRRSDFVHGGLGLGIPAILTTAAQLWVIVGVQHGTHRADAPMAFPWEYDFWLFMLGKIARSLMLPMVPAKLSLVITALATLGLVVVFAKSIITIARNKSTRNTEPLLIFAALCAIVFVYLLLISAGRTNLRPDNINSAIDIFSYGFYRFHFFWVTLLWPWLACLIINWLKEQRGAGYLILPLSIIITCGWLIACNYTSIIDNGSFFKSTMRHRVDGLRCVTERIQQPGPVRCNNIDLGDIDKGLKNGIVAGASFARTLHVLPIALGTNSPRPAYRLSENITSVQIMHAEVINNDTVSLNLKTENDPSIIFVTTEDISQCGMLDISASIVSPENTLAQIFYLARGDAGYSEAHSTTASVAASPQPQIINFSVQSLLGFERQLRFDPVVGSQAVSVQDLEVRCRSSVNAD